jgi:hypothetical protein
MIDLATAVQTALFEALRGSVTLAPVFQHVPENQPPPVAIVGEGAIEPIGGKDSRFERHEIDIVTVIAGPGRKPLNALQEQVRAALDAVDLPAQAGAELSAPVLLNTTTQLLDDGVTYYGAQRFLIFAQPA